MSPEGPFAEAVYTNAFKRDYKRASPEMRAAADTAIKKLVATGPSGSHRFHALNGYKPKIFKVDLDGPRWQISFRIEGSTLILRRLGPHKQLDRNP